MLIVYCYCYCLHLFVIVYIAQEQCEGTEAILKIKQSIDEEAKRFEQKINTTNNTEKSSSSTGQPPPPPPDYYAHLPAQ